MVVPSFSEQRQGEQHPAERGLRGSCACSCDFISINGSSMERQTYMKVLLKNEIRIMGSQEGILAKAQVT